MLTDGAATVAAPVAGFLVALAVVAMAWRRPSRWAASLSLFLVLTAAWALCRGLELSPQTGSIVLICQKVQESCVALCAPVWLVFALSHFESGFRAGTGMMVVLLAFPLLSVVGIWAGDIYAWVRVQQPIFADYPQLTLEQAYSWLALTWAAFLGLRAYLTNGGLYRRRVALHLIASLLLVGATAIHEFGLIGSALVEALALTATLAGSVVLWALSGCRPRQVLPVARAAVFGKMADAVLVLDANHTIIDANPAAERLFWGDQNAAIVGRRVSEILPLNADAIELDMADGRRSFDLRVTNLKSRHGIPGGYFVVLHDATDMRRAQEDLTSSDVRLDLVLEATNDSVWDWRPATDSLYLSPQLYRGLGYDVAALPQSFAEWQALIHPSDVPDLDLLLASIKSGETDSLGRDFRVQTSSGEWHWVHVRGRVISRAADGTPTRIVGVHSDSEATRANEASLSYRALYDELTAIPNRFLLLDRLRLEFARSSRQGTSFALAFCDINEFKAINDTHGHAAGDDLLKQVARRLTACVRETDTVARMGGDEFVLILTAQKGDRVQTAIAGDRIIQQMGEPFVLGGKRVRVTMGMGIALAPQHGSTVESLMKGADAAMYAAKAKGVSQYRFFSPEFLPQPTTEATVRAPRNRVPRAEATDTEVAASPAVV